MAQPTLTQHQQLLKDAKEALRLNNGNFDALTANQKKAIETEYSFAVNLILSDPQLMSLFDRAVKQEWTDERFKLEAEGNQWFKDRNATQEWFQIRVARMGAIDPASLTDMDYLDSRISESKDLTEAKDEIILEINNTVVENLGLNVDDEKNKKIINDIANQILSTKYMSIGGWRKDVAGMVGAAFKQVKPTDVGGTVAKAMTDVRQTYRSLGMSLTDDDAARYASGIISGKTNINTINQNVRKNASQMWTQFSDRIMAGESLQNILYPYTQMIGSMLELDPDSLDFTTEDATKPASKQIDPLLQQAMFSGADGKQVMSLTDLRKSIKKDARWQNTKNAQDEYATLTTQLMRMFGAGV